MPSHSAKAAAQTAVTPEPAAPIDYSVRLAERATQRLNEFINAFGSTDFYIQLMFIGIALISAKLISMALRKRIEGMLAHRQFKLVDTKFVMRLSKLLTPALLVISFVIAKVTFSILDIDSGCFDVAMKLGVAYMLARCVVLVVHNRAVAYFIATVIMLVAIGKSLRIMRSVNGYLESQALEFGQFNITLLGVIHGAVALVVVFWFAGQFTNWLDGYLRRSTSVSYNARVLLMRCFRIVMYSVAALVTLSYVGVDLTAFAIFGGAVGVGIGLGLQKITSNFFSSVTLLMEKSVRIGDLIEVSGNAGWVRQLNTRYALLETMDGRDIMIPNEVLVSSNLTNWTHSSSRAQVAITVVIDYSSDAIKARELMLEAVSECSASLKDPAPGCVLQDFTDNGMRMVLDFWISDIRNGRAKPKSEVMFAIVEKFRKAGISMARPIAIPPAAPKPALP